MYCFVPTLCLSCADLIETYRPCSLVVSFGMKGSYRGLGRLLANSVILIAFEGESNLGFSTLLRFLKDLVRRGYYIFH